MLRFGIKKLQRNDSHSLRPLSILGGLPVDLRFLTSHAHLLHFDTTIIRKIFITHSVRLTAVLNRFAAPEIKECFLSENKIVLCS